MLKRIEDYGGGPPPEEFVVVVVGEHEYRISKCAYVASGIRCGFAGTISHTTMNHGPKNDEPSSKFYCTRHFDCHDAKYGALVVEQSHQPRPPQEEKPPAKLPIRTGNLAWAHRILDRAAAGERMPAYSLQCARAVIGPEREPGEDEGEKEP